MPLIVSAPSNHPSEASTTHQVPPVLDFGRWLKPASAKDKTSFAQELVATCRKHGFALLSNHGVDPHLEEAFSYANKFFAMPLHKKMSAVRGEEPDDTKGYTPIGAEKVGPCGRQGKPADATRNPVEVDEQMESFKLGTEHVPSSDKGHDKGNHWPPDRMLPGFRALMVSFWEESLAPSQEIVAALATGFGLADDDAEKVVQAHDFSHQANNVNLRLTHYPPVAVKKLRDGRAARMPVHTDFATCNLTFQDDVGGLQVEVPGRAGEFVDVPAQKGVAVLHVGDSLTRWTNGTVPESLHRVSVPPGKEQRLGMAKARHAVSLYIGPRSEALIEPLPGFVTPESPSRYKPVRFGEFRKSRDRCVLPNDESAE